MDSGPIFDLVAAFVILTIVCAAWSWRRWRTRLHKISQDRVMSQQQWERALETHRKRVATKDDWGWPKR